MIQLPHKPRFERKWIEKHLSKTHYKKPYDRFMWWRGYTPKNKPLDKRSTLSIVLLGMVHTYITSI